MITSNVDTLNLNGAETAIEFEQGYPYIFITNKGDTDMYVSLSPNITAKAEGVYTVSPGASERIGMGYPIKKFYITGSGEAYIRGEQIAAPPSFKRGEKGGDSNGKILLNLPLTNDLSDVSGFNRVVTYTGDTPLTITPDDGIFLYKGSLRLADAAFLTDIPIFTMEFDMKVEQKGVDLSTAYSREFAYIYGKSEGLWYGIGCAVSYRNSSDPAPLQMYVYDNTKNKRNFEYTLNSSYNDGKYHHIVIHYDNTSNFIYTTIDDGDPIVMWFSKNVIGSISWGRNDSYGLNGYIKNIIIKK